MGLADRLAALDHDTGCRTCKHYKSMTAKDREAFDAWVASKNPLSLLRDACEKDGLKVSDRAFRDHINNHHKTGKLT